MPSKVENLSRASRSQDAMRAWFKRESGNPDLFPPGGGVRLESLSLLVRAVNDSLDSTGHDDAELADEIGGSLAKVSAELNRVRRKAQLRWGHLRAWGTMDGELAKIDAATAVLTRLVGRGGELLVRPPGESGATLSARRARTGRDEVLWWLEHEARMKVDAQRAAAAAIAMGLEGPCEGAEFGQRVDRWRKRLGNS